jgi:hypothetical protein
LRPCSRRIPWQTSGSSSGSSFLCAFRH